MRHKDTQTVGREEESTGGTHGNYINSLFLDQNSCEFAIFTVNERNRSQARLKQD